MKNLLFLVLGIYLFQSCTSSPSAQSASGDSTSVFDNPSAVSLGNSPGDGYRLFKVPRDSGSALVLMRLSDTQQWYIANSSLPEPKFYWSNGSKYLVIENSMPDSIYQNEVLIFDLANVSVARKMEGWLLGFDIKNDVAICYRPQADRQIITALHMDNLARQTSREIIGPPVGKLPSIVIVGKERRVRVKAYTTDYVPINISFEY